MSREDLGRAAKVVSGEVARKRTCREYMDLTAENRVQRVTLKRLVVPGDERLDPNWHSQSCLWSLTKALHREQLVPM